MNRKKYIITSLIVFIIYIILTSLFHVIIFGGVWEIGLTLGDLVWAFLFVYFLIRFNHSKRLVEGIKFSLLIGLFFCCPIIFGFFPFEAITHSTPEAVSDAILPGIIPSAEAIFWFTLTIIKFIICGILTSFFYKPVNS